MSHNFVAFCQIHGSVVYIVDATTGETLRTFTTASMMTIEEEEDAADRLDIEQLACSGGKIAITWGKRTGGAVTLIDGPRGDFTATTLAWDVGIFGLTFSGDGTVVLVRDPHALTFVDVERKVVTTR